MSGDDNYLSCNQDGSKFGLYNPFSRTLNYDVFVPDESTHCSEFKQGGKECADECCAVQDKYCQDNNLLKELWPYYQCMLDRGCEGVINTKISGNTGLTGNTCNVGSSSEPSIQNLKYAVPCFLDITCDHKCGSNQQGGDACNKDCCEEQESFCRKSNGNMGAYFKCMAVRGCRDGDFISCNQDDGTTYQVDTLIKSTHCDTYWQGNDLGCSDECCKEQHDYCLANATGVADYYECMHDRSCGNTADELIHSKPPEPETIGGITIIGSSNERPQVTIDGEEKYCVVPNSGWLLPWVTLCAGDECDYRCGTGYMGGLPCQKKCCDYQKDKWCKATNPEVRGYFHCMWVRGCKNQLSIDITGNKEQTGNICSIPLNVDGQEKNFGVPCAVWGDCTEKCGSWQQGGAACRNKCCNKQEGYCRSNNPTMEGYFKCMDDRGCPESKFISCHYDDFTNYDVYPPDSDDHCGTNRQGDHLYCTPKCCEKQEEYCTGAATCLQEHFRCMDDRGCKDEVKKTVNGDLEQTQKCDLPKDYMNAYDVPCDLDGSCKYKCGSWLQGGLACRDDCCESQDEYCRGSNGSMEGYFECLISRGCKDEIKCDYDNGTNYDIDPGNLLDRCGSIKQGVTYGETAEETKIHELVKGRSNFSIATWQDCKEYATSNDLVWGGKGDGKSGAWKDRPNGCIKKGSYVYYNTLHYMIRDIKCGSEGYACLQQTGCTRQCCEKQSEYCTGAATCLQNIFVAWMTVAAKMKQHII